MNNRCIPAHYENNIFRYFSRANPTDWWKNYAERYPRVAKLARCNLCRPATSVPSERVFSAAGLTVNRLRTRLTPEHVNMLIFMNKNT